MTETIVSRARKEREYIMSRPLMVGYLLQLSSFSQLDEIFRPIASCYERSSSGRLCMCWVVLGIFGRDASSSARTSKCILLVWGILLLLLHFPLIFPFYERRYEKLHKCSRSWAMIEGVSEVGVVLFRSNGIGAQLLRLCRMRARLKQAVCEVSDRRCLTRIKTDAEYKGLRQGAPAV
jgi:hypothetical protein